MTHSCHRLYRDVTRRLDELGFPPPEELDSEAQELILLFFRGERTLITWDGEKNRALFVGRVE